MDGDEPGGDEIDQVMENIRVCDAIYGGVNGEKEEDQIGDVADAV